MATGRTGIARIYGVFPLLLLFPHHNVALSSSATTGSSRDLLIVGCGTLGTLAGVAWQREFPDAIVVGETMTDTRHKALRAEGIVPSLRTDRQKLLASRSIASKNRSSSGRFPYILFCAAPRASGDKYPQEVSAALQECWMAHSNNTEEKMKDAIGFVFTSSGGVFAEDSGGVVNEASAVSDSERAKRLLAAEREVLSRRGGVVRLAGLYTATRGAHSYWFTQDEVNGNAESIVNLLHYEDAAGVAIAALLRGALDTTKEKQLYLASDDEPLSRSEICNAALSSKMYADAKSPRFTGTGATGKIYDTTETRRRLRWKPQYPSFKKFMKAL